MCLGPQISRDMACQLFPEGTHTLADCAKLPIPQYQKVATTSR